MAYTIMAYTIMARYICLVSLARIARISHTHARTRSAECPRHSCTINTSALVTISLHMSINVLRIWLPHRKETKATYRNKGTTKATQRNKGNAAEQTPGASTDRGRQKDGSTPAATRLPLARLSPGLCFFSVGTNALSSPSGMRTQKAGLSQQKAMEINER